METDYTDDEAYGALDRVCPICGHPEGYSCEPDDPDDTFFLHRARILQSLKSMEYVNRFQSIIIEKTLREL